MTKRVKPKPINDKSVFTNNKNTENKVTVARPGISTKMKLCIILGILSFLIYANTLQNGYVLDDVSVVTENTIVQKGFSGIPELLVTPRLKGYERVTDEESYRPVPLITHAIEHELFGFNPVEGHLSNIIIFIGCVIALFLFLNNLFNSAKTGIAFIASLLFALHPIHTEVVANIKSRDELLCFLFAFLSLNLFVNYARDGRLKQLLTAMGMLFLSFLSKETVITFLFIIPLVFFFYVNENRKRSLIISVAALLVTMAFLTARVAVLGMHHSNTIYFLSNPLVSVHDPFVRIATAIMVLDKYLKLLFIPYPLICDYCYNSIPLVGFGNVFALLSLTVYLLLATIGIYRLIKIRRDPWAFGILFFLGTLPLFSNIPFLVYSEMAERFLFFPSAGFCLSVALVYDRWVSKSEISGLSMLKNKRALITIIPVCLIFSALTVTRNVEWKDNYSLFSADLKKSDRNCQLYYCLATEISHNLYPNEPNPASRLQLDQESINYLNHAVAIYPDFEGAHLESGRIYEQLQMSDSAIVHDLRVLRINPKSIVANYNLGRAYYFLKKYPESIGFFKTTLALQPDILFANLNLACCYSDFKQYDSAIVYFNKTLALDPKQPQARQGLAFAYAMKYKQDSTSKNKK